MPQMARASGALEGRLSEVVHRLGRYGLVSAASSVAGTGLLVLFVEALHWPPMLANAVGACICLAPVYLVSRRWVWRMAAGARVTSEAVPFLAVSLTTVLAASLMAAAAQGWARRLQLSHAVGTSFMVCTVVATYGTLWLLRFLLLDRVLFARSSEIPHEI